MAIRFSLRELSRNQRRKFSEGDHGEVAEELAAEELNLAHAPREETWYDLRPYSHQEKSTKIEVKSAHRRVGDDYPAAGRFRVRRDQHRSLAASDGQSTAWYAFVLFDEETGDVVIQKRRPSTVTKIVDERGGWNRAGHEEFDEQHKLPIGTVIDG